MSNNYYKMPKTQQEADGLFEFEHLFGKCHIFAIALHRVLGLQIHFYWDEEAYFEVGPNGEEDYTGQALVHAYAIDAAGNVYDVRGHVDLEWCLDEYEANEPYTQHIGAEEIDSIVEEWHLSYTTEEYAACVEFITRRTDLFKNCRCVVA